MKEHAPITVALLAITVQGPSLPGTKPVSVTVWCESAPKLSVEGFGISVAIPKDKLDALRGQSSWFLSATVA